MVSLVKPRSLYNAFSVRTCYRVGNPGCAAARRPARRPWAVESNRFAVGPSVGCQSANLGLFPFFASVIRNSLFDIRDSFSSDGCYCDRVIFSQPLRGILVRLLNLDGDPRRRQDEFTNTPIPLRGRTFGRLSIGEPWGVSVFRFVIRNSLFDIRHSLSSDGCYCDRVINSQPLRGKTNGAGCSLREHYVMFAERTTTKRTLSFDRENYRFRDRFSTGIAPKNPCIISSQVWSPYSTSSVGSGLAMLPAELS